MRTVCGLDVHKDSIFVCILNENGILFQDKIGVLTPDLERLVDVLHEHGATEVCKGGAVGVDAADAFFEGDIFGFGDEELGIIAFGLEFG